MKLHLARFTPSLPRVALCALAALAIAGIAATDKADKAVKTSSKEDPKASPVSLAISDRPVARDGKLGFSFSPVVKKVGPSVVKITSTVKAREVRSDEFLPGMDDPMLRRFFGENSRGNGRSFRTPPQQGVGSGVVVTKDGYIVTNNHVVEGADEVKVALLDGREFTARVIGKDPKSDVAVVKVDATDLPALEIADSDKIEVGDLVLAVGNPFNIGQTVTMGLVSATGRATLGLDYEDFIQTDAAINPGNSGGALVDVEGRLIGINTAILSRSGGNQGIGFAIPVNLARDVMNSLVTDGKVTRGYLGVMIQDVTPALARKLDLKQQQGALISGVEPKSPADRAGLRSGDVVIEIDGKPVTDSRHLKLAAGRTKPGESVTVKILRDGATRKVDVTVKELPGAEQVAKTGTNHPDDGEALRGVAVADLDAKLRRQFHVPENIRGAVVVEVEDGSPASEAGLKTGDVILEINKQAVKGSEDAVRLTERSKDKTTLLRLWSNGGNRFLVVDESHAG
ncbi:MAG: serine protease Do [Verrucomicrobiota bacterium]